MDESVSENLDMAAKTPPSYGLVITRALLSAAIFGVIGGWLGRWLGMRGNAEGSNMAQPIMQWGMAGFWALVAAHSSLKASGQEMQPAQIMFDEDRREFLAANTKIPLASINVQGSAHGGELAQTREQQRG